MYCFNLLRPFLKSLKVTHIKIKQQKIICCFIQVDHVSSLSKCNFCHFYTIKQNRLYNISNVISVVMSNGTILFLKDAFQLDLCIYIKQQPFFITKSLDVKQDNQQNAEFKIFKYLSLLKKTITKYTVIVSTNQ